MVFEVACTLVYMRHGAFANGLQTNGSQRAGTCRHSGKPGSDESPANAFFPTLAGTDRHRDCIPWLYCPAGRKPPYKTV
jgi:hypothetical protein